MAERYQVRGRRIWDSSNDSYSQLFPSADMAEWALKNNGKSIVFQPLDQWQDDKPNGDAVNRPDHYTQGPVECIDAIEAAMSTDQFIGFLRGQVIKYAWRLGLKGEAVEDARKGTWYFTRLIKTLKK